MTVSLPDHSRGQLTIVLSREDKDCAFLHSCGPIYLMLSVTGTMNPGTAIAGLSGEQLWTELLS
jgi:hypothetical protein